MTPATKVWEKIEQDTIEGARALAAFTSKACRKEMVARIQRLIDSNVCPPSASAWINPRKAKGRKGYNLEITKSATGRIATGRIATEHIRDHLPAIPLNSLKLLADGTLLSFGVRVDSSTVPQAMYTVALQGAMRKTGNPWYARMEIHEPGKGSGRCGHPLLHLHTGSAPDDPLQVRGPLPWLMPWEALDWLLTTADRRFEPCPHE